MGNFQNWSLDRLRDELDNLGKKGYDRGPDYTGVDKYDGPDAWREKSEKNRRYCEISEEIQKRLTK